jgi:perosamine synthetase
MNVLPYARQSLDEEDIAAVVGVLRGDWLTQGPTVSVFEKCVADACGAAEAVAFSSGTAALHAAVAVAGLGPGDEAITSPLSFVASANCMVYQGATPRFSDVTPGEATMDPAALEKAFTARTRVVIPVDFAGQPAALEEIQRVAHAHKAVVIEDACHALGADYHGRPVGSLSDMTVFSFHPVKHVTTGEGGMVMTQRREWADRLRRFRSHGIARPAVDPRPWFYEMVELGFNYRLTDLQCALGLSQMKKLGPFLERRRFISEQYDQAFASVPGVRPLKETPGTRSARHLYVVRLDYKLLRKDRVTIMSELRSLGVGSQVHYIPIHRHPFYEKRFGYKAGNFPHAESFYEEALSLPLFPAMTAEDVHRVVRAVERVAGVKRENGK